MTRASKGADASGLPAVLKAMTTEGAPRRDGGRDEPRVYFVVAGGGPGLGPELVRVDGGKPVCLRRVCIDASRGLDCVHARAARQHVQVHGYAVAAEQPLDVDVTREVAA